MAVAEIIGAAIGVLMLVVVAYILVGGTLTAAETVANAQKDLTLQNEVRLNTMINLSDQKISGGTIKFNVTNTGNEIISDFEHTDVYTFNNSPSPTYYAQQRLIYDAAKSGSPGTWFISQFEHDYVHPTQLDPGEKMWCEAVFVGVNPVWIGVVTGNGVYDSGII